ncbi:MAG: carboxypeptidase-like regulatory domain-containing protein [Candidatus Diapherotrites archaeon]
MAENGIFDQIKQFYLSMEDKYYDVLDKINKKIPILKITDAIDKVFPSFLLLLILLFLFFIASIAVVFILVTGSSVATIHVIDDDGDSVADVSVELTFSDGTTKDLKTDAFGRFSFNLNGEEVEINIEDEEYESFNETVTVSATEETEIVLTKLGAASSLLQKAIEVKDFDTQNPLTGAQISFRCSNNPALAPSSIYNADTIENVLVDSSCGILTATLRLSGFEDATRTLTGPKTIILMKKVSQETFDSRVIVNVTAEDTGDALVGMSMVLYKDGEIHARGQSDATGRKVFDVAPGEYYVKVTDTSFPAVYYTTESAKINVQAGDTETIAVKMPLITSDDPVGKIQLKFVDKKSGSPIENVQAVFFEDGVYSAAPPSNSSSKGRVDLFNADFNKSYSVSASHPDYIFKITLDLPVIALNNTEVKEIELVKAESPAKFGDIIVLVQNGEETPIKDAQVHLFDKDIEFSILTGTTNSEGKITFKNMPVGLFKAVASATGQDGESPYTQLNSGVNLLLEITLILQKGTIEVEVIDGFGRPVEGANVKFVDEFAGRLTDEVTDSEGKIDPQEFYWNLKPYLEVTKSGYLLSRTSAYDLAPKSTTEVQVVLRETEYIDQLTCVSNQDLCIGLGFNAIIENTPRRKVATMFEENKHYILLFDVYVGKDMEDVTAVVRTGLEADMTAGASNIVIEGGAGAGEASFIRDDSYNTQDNYVVASPTNNDGKQALVSFGDLAAGLYSFEVEIFIKPNQEDDAEIEIRYGVTGVSGSTDLYVPNEDELIFLFFQLNEPISCDPENADCPNFIFSGSIRPDVEGGVARALDPDGIQELTIGTEYEIILNITYLNQEVGVLSNVSMDATHNSNALTVSPNPLSIGSLLPNSLTSIAFTVTPELSTGLTSIDFELSENLPENSISYEFSIAEQEAMSISAHPRQIIENTSTFVGIEVTSPQDNPVSGAVVEWASTWDGFDGTNVLPYTDALGITGVTIPPRDKGDHIYFKATSPYYKESDVLEVKVVDSSSFELSPFSFACVSITDGGGSALQDAGLGFEGEYLIPVIHGNQAIFEINTLNCPKNVKVALNVGTSSSNAAGSDSGRITLRDGANIELGNDCARTEEGPIPCDARTLSTTDSLTVKAHANKLLGEYDVEIRLMYEGDPGYYLTNIVRIIVERSAGEQTFSISKPYFNIFNGPDTAVITNNSFVDIDNFWYPKVDLPADIIREYNIDPDRYADIPSSATVDWTVTLVGTKTNTSYLTVESEAEPACIDHRSVTCLDCTWLCSQSSNTTSCEAPAGTCQRNGITLKIPNPADVTAIKLEEVWFAPGGGGEIFIVKSDGSKTRIYNKTPEGCSASPIGSEILDSAFDLTDILIVDGAQTGVTFDVKASTGAGCTEHAYVGAKISIDSGSEPINYTFSDSKTISISIDNAADSYDLGTVDLSEIPPLDPSSGDFIIPKVTTTNPMFDVWLEQGTTSLTVKGLFIGSTEYVKSKDIDITASNISLIGRDYGLLMVEDYVLPTGDTAVETSPFSYTITVANDAGEELPRPSTAEFVIPYDGEEHELTGTALTGVAHTIELPSLSGTIVSYSIEAPEGSPVVVYFKEGDTGDPASVILGSTPPTKVFARTAYTQESSNSVQAIMLIDTSGSMDNEWDTVCAVSDKIEANLKAAGFDVDFSIYGMEVERGCATGKVQWPADFNIIADDPVTMVTADFYDHKEEAWGVLGYELIDKFDWDSDSRKMIVIISDSDPTGVGRETECAFLWFGCTTRSMWRDGIETKVVNQLVKKANDNGVSLFFISPIDMESKTMNKISDPLKNDAEELMEWAARQTGGAWQQYSAEPDTDFSVQRFALLIERSLYPKDTEYFHVRVDAGKDNVCYGANDITGVTGPNAIPKIITSWSRDAVLVDSCDKYVFGSRATENNEAFAYCDAAQFSTEILKKLERYEDEVIGSGDSTYASEYLNFESYLIRDGYTADFVADYGEYIQSTFFEGTTTLDGIFSEDRITFEGLELDEALPVTGLYAVTITLDYDNGNQLFFVGSGGSQQLNVRVNVNFTKIQELSNENQFYYLPFDGVVGREVLPSGSVVLKRDGYGVGFTGDISELGLYDVGSSGSPVIDAVQGTPLVPSVQIIKSTDFKVLNNTSRGNLLGIIPHQGGKSIYYTPSYPVPILMKAENISENNRTDIAAFLVLRKTGTIVDIETSSLTEWDAFSSNLTPSCTVFSGENALEFRNYEDGLLGDSETTCDNPNDPNDSFGFEWADTEPKGVVSNKTIFYVPDNSSYSITNACTNIAEKARVSFISHGATISTDSSSGTNLDLRSNIMGSSVQSVTSLADIFQLIEDEYICVSTEESGVANEQSTKFWWNPKKVFNDLAISQKVSICSLEICSESPEACAS